VTEENQIKTDICDWLQSRGYLFTLHIRSKQKFKPKYARNGWPDIVGVCPNGKALLIEVKKPGGTLSIEQHKVLERAKAMGAITVVAVSVDDVCEALSLSRP
jgi:hypothetical protein